CLEVGVLDPSILKTEHLLRHPRSVILSLEIVPPAARAAHSRASGFVLWPFSTFATLLNHV
ncbi:MAG TPA: hypothetical protein VGJ20_13325, partial [Xanthobacteraceae bacterium]